MLEQPRISLQVDSPQNALAMVRAGISIALIDAFPLMAYQNDCIVAVPVEEEAPLIASLVYLQTEPLTKAAQAFIEILKQVIDKLKLEPATIYR